MECFTQLVLEKLHDNEEKLIHDEIPLTERWNFHASYFGQKISWKQN